MYSVLADALLLPHLFFILWVIFRAAFVRRRCAGFTLPPSWGHAHRTPALDLPANLGRKLAEDESRTSTVTGQILAVLSPRACLPNISRGLLTVVASPSAFSIQGSMSSRFGTVCGLVECYLF